VSSGSVIPHQTLTQRTADVLTSDIMVGAFGDTDSLPSVRELSDRYGVSSLVIRESLAHLQARGLLERRQGRRTKVVKPTHNAITAVLRFSALQGEPPLDELQDCREPLEIKAAELAARSDRTDKAELLEPILERMAKARSARAFNDNDLALHMTIAQLSGNSPIEMILAALSDVMREVLDVTYRRVATKAGSQGIEGAFALHDRVARAIIANDPEEARTAMSAHFSYSSEEHS